ncbi:Nramp family divalent metal transporter [Aliagarivorans taiwanensis]|uniref:Nramp family divalent metal transporter n=1 Tax=Aliagarivorans taiwanensis TaxID=561966 RepID=UPI0004114E22|nr:Nramp family divalent metal transporter [Aliagarivorans taiwanensis]
MESAQQTVAADQTVSSSPSFSTKLSALGPGVMMAAAAIGGSHLVASTQAGALFGWALLGLIVLVNFLKYPFYQFGARYTAVTGESLLAGYRRLGKPVLVAFLLLCLFAGVVSVAALIGLSTALIQWFLPGASKAVIACTLTAISAALILLGHYKMVDRVTKIIVALLALITVVVAAMALTQPSVAQVDFVRPSPWTLASMGFLIALMGWMPAPLEISAMNSVWAKAKYQHRKPNLKAVLFDMNVGYIATAFLAVCFLVIGAQLMHGSGVELSRNGASFAGQLADAYAAIFGSSIRYVVVFAALCCIYSSALSCTDGYARVTWSAISNLAGQDPHDSESPLMICVISAGALAMVLLFPGSLLGMLHFAMLAAFLTTPFIALINRALMHSDHVPEDQRPGRWMKLWSLSGLLFLFGFAAVFVWWQWFN